MDQLQMQKLKKNIDRAKIVSFDLYDTLIFRKTKTPQDLFAYVEWDSRIPGFAADRENMQRKAARFVRRMYGYPHPNLREIYQYWKCKSRGRKEAFYKKLLQAEQTERKLEQCLAVRNNAMDQAMQYAKARGKRIILTSDMYLEKPEIENILKRCAVTQWDALYVSSEARKTKYDGSIYGFIIKKERARPGEILHIGDDPHSDIKMARAKGIRTFWYKDKEADLAESLYRYSRQKGTLPIQKAAFWYNLGYQTGGPLYLGLCLWIKETLGKKKLFCLSRDGANLVRLLPQFGVGDAVYIYASRRALLVPYLAKAGKKQRELLPRYGRRMYQKNTPRILALSRLECANLERYFASEGLFQKEVCFFDSGWNGTSQYLMENIFKSFNKKGKIRFYYAGIKDNAASRQMLKGCCYKSYFSGYLKKRTQNRLLASSAVLELFFSEDAPAVRCYGKDGVQFDAYEKRDSIRWINQGIEDFIRSSRGICSVVSKEAVKRFGISRLVKLVLSPDAREAEWIGNLEIADRFSEAGGRKKQVARIPKEALWENPLLDIYWEQGVYRHPENTRSVKVYVWCRQRAAELYRAVKRGCGGIWGARE